jgi:glycosyltransferase involved in cell wall biosynthesis
MRIAYVCADLGVPVFGRKGCSIHVQEVLRALVGQGAQVDLFAFRTEGEPPAGLSSIRLHSLFPAPKGDCAERERAALAANHNVRDRLEHEGPFDLVYERYSLWSFAAMEYSREHGTPGLLEVNAPLIEEQAEYRTLIDRAGAEQVAGRAFRAATAIVAVSDEVAAYLRRWPDTHGRVHVIANGVNPERFSMRCAAALAPHDGTLTIGFLGTLKRWHGLSTLVDAFGRLQERSGKARLLIVGDGPERESVAADLAARKLTPYVHFAGSVAPDDVPAWLASMNVAVAPYPRLDSFYFSPLKVYEYMAAGLPVVASRIGQLAELIQDGVNGLLVAPGDAGALADALDCLRLEPALRKRLGRAARATVLRGHTWKAVVERIYELAALEPTTPVLAGNSPTP